MVCWSSDEIMAIYRLLLGPKFPHNQNYKANLSMDRIISRRNRLPPLYISKLLKLKYFVDVITNQWLNLLLLGPNNQFSLEYYTN